MVETDDQILYIYTAFVAIAARLTWRNPRIHPTEVHFAPSHDTHLASSHRHRSPLRGCAVVGLRLGHERDHATHEDRDPQR